MKKNSRGCFEFDSCEGTIKSENACEWGMKYQSVVGYGRATFLEDPAEKAEAFDIIMRQYPKRSFEYSEKALVKCTIIVVETEWLTGKVSGYS